MDKLTDEQLDRLGRTTNNDYVRYVVREVQQARQAMTAHQYKAAVDAYWDDDASAVGDCDGCALTGARRYPVCRDDGVVWMICDGCMTHDHLRNCRQCHVALPVRVAQVVDKEGGWNYCPDHAPAF